jgi:hypothetical protein
MEAHRMKRITLALATLMAVSILAIAALNGCGSSTPGDNLPLPTRTEIATDNAVIMATVDDITDNDAFDMLNSPLIARFLNLGGLGIPQLLRAPQNPAGVIRALRPRPSKPNTNISLPTGTYRVIGDTDVVKSSEIPRDGLLVIAHSASAGAAAADSDSVRISNLHTGTLQTGTELDTIPTALTINMYAAHPTHGVAPGLVGTFTYAMTLDEHFYPYQVRLTMDVTSVIYCAITVTLDGAHHTYSLGFDINARRQNVTESLTLRLHTTSDLLRDTTTAEITAIDVLGSHTVNGRSWANNIYLTDFYLNGSTASEDTARVTGNILRNNREVATIGGSFHLTLAEGDTCQPIYVTIKATNETVLACDVYGDLSVPPVLGHPRNLYIANNSRRWYR